jgi:hypothetical protein
MQLLFSFLGVKEMIKHFIAILIFSCLLTGCVAKYARSNFLKAGYTDSRLSKCDFVVGYKEGLFNNATNPAKRDQFIMIRAAELTLIHGHTHFTVAPIVGTMRVQCYSAQDAPEDAYDARQFLFLQKNQKLPS